MDPGIVFGIVGCVVGVVGIGISIWTYLRQSKETRNAQAEARAAREESKKETAEAQAETRKERERAATLEGHLSRQRWQQLLSLGDQIDAIEESGRQSHTALDAALHASLKQQFSSLLGMIATATPDYSSTTIRRWMAMGRLDRPWQVREAATHLDAQKPENLDWLEQLDIVRPPTSVAGPKELNETVAAHILVAHSLQPELTQLLRNDGHEYAATVLLAHLAEDCIARSAPTAGRETYRAWGADVGASFANRLAHYSSIHFWTLTTATDAVRRSLMPFRDHFDSGTPLGWWQLFPTADAVERAQKLFPKLNNGMSRVLQPIKQ